MPVKGGAAEMREIDGWDGGFGWLAYPDEAMQRASHALSIDGDLWLLDPVDVPELDASLDDRGTVAGVAVCLDRHSRDAAAIATRHGVSVSVPEWMDGVAGRIDAPVDRFGSELGDTGYRAITVRDAAFPRWQEVALHDPGSGTLYVPEAVGTAPFFLARDERLGVHPMLRLTPPRSALGGLGPERVLVGHGEGAFTDVATALEDALAGARRRAPSAYATVLRSVL